MYGLKRGIVWIVMGGREGFFEERYLNRDGKGRKELGIKGERDIIFE